MGLALLAVVGAVLANVVGIPLGFGGPLWWRMAYAIFVVPLTLIAVTAPFASTILGWIAVSQIRNSKGRLHGMGLAVFDGLLFPLLALDGALVAVCFAVFKAFDSGLKLMLLLPVLIVGLLVLDWLIIRGENGNSRAGL